MQSQINTLAAPGRCCWGATAVSSISKLLAKQTVQPITEDVFAPPVEYARLAISEASGERATTGAALAACAVTCHRFRPAGMMRYDFETRIFAPCSAG